MFTKARRWSRRYAPRPTPPRPRRLGVEPLEDRLAPAVLDVLGTADGVAPVIVAGHAGTAADPYLAPSLRSAISFANRTPGGNTINLTAGGTYQITLAGTPGEADNKAGELAILPGGGDLTIRNASVLPVSVDGKQLYRVFDINPNFNPASPTPKFTVTLTGLTVQNGVATDPANPYGPNASGGGIRAIGNASLTLNNVVVTHNSAVAGGGIAMANTVSAPWALTVNASTVSDNLAVGGGGIETDGSGQVLLNAGTVITGNTVYSVGGGIWLSPIAAGPVPQSADLTVTGAVISDNSALGGVTSGVGGGVGNGGNGTVLIRNSTLANNRCTAGEGTGGAFAGLNGLGTLTVQNSLFLGNDAAFGGAVYADCPFTRISGSEFKGNEAVVGAGVLAVGQSLTVANSTFVGNTAVAGGGIEVETTGVGAYASAITSTTITGNFSDGVDVGARYPGGGGGSFTGTLTLLNDTITANSNYDLGGANYSVAGGGLTWAEGGAVNVENTILAGNRFRGAGSDYVTTNGTRLTSLGGNLVGISNGDGAFTQPGDQAGTAANPLNPLLGPLQDNGGPTAGAPAGTGALQPLTLQTEALLPGSPAVGKGTLTATPTTDERGLVPAGLLTGGPTDVGAFQSLVATPRTLSAAPGNGDVNPSGVAFVPANFPAGGTLQPGDLLVSHFNSAQNVPGTGTTITRIDAAGHASTFFTSPLPGLSGALGTLQAGFVVVGNVPNDNGVPGAGALQFIDGNGKVVLTLTDPTLIDGPLGLAVANDTGSSAQVFVANGPDGTVSRFDLRIQNGQITVASKYQIASGYATRVDDTAFVLGPSGLAYDTKDLPFPVLYVASAADNKIFYIPSPDLRVNDLGPGVLVVNDPAHLHAPSGLAVLPDGGLLAANSDAQSADPNQPSEVVEYSLAGLPVVATFVGQFSVDPANGGASGLGLATTPGGAVKLAAVDANTNTVRAWDVEPGSVAGSVFQDHNGDGQLNGSDAGLSGVTVNLLGPGGAVLATTTTDVNGNYSFANVAAGSYQVSLIPPAGLVPTTRPAGVTVGSKAATASPLGLYSFASLTGSTLTVTGTPGADTASVVLGATDTVYFDGGTYSVPAAAVTAINYVGNGGADTVYVTDPAAGDVAILSPNSGVLQGHGYTVSVSGVNVLVLNGSGSDRAYLNDSPGNDLFVGTPTYAYLYGTGFWEQANGFGVVLATSQAGGSDTAYLFDSPGNDAFVGTPTYAYLYGTGFFNQANGFKVVVGNATAGGTDTAYLYDSPGNDLFVGTPTYSYLSGGGVLNEVFGFKAVVANSTAGGDDQALLFGSPGGDVLVGTPAYSYLYGSGFWNQANGFQSVHASGGGGQDVAYFYGAPSGDDSLAAQGNAATLTGQGYALGVDSFAQVVASLTGTGTHHKQVGAIDYLFTALGDFS
jgi:hypothetical protein